MKKACEYGFRKFSGNFSGKRCHLLPLQRIIICPPDKRRLEYRRRGTDAGIPDNAMDEQTEDSENKQRTLQTLILQKGSNGL